MRLAGAGALPCGRRSSARGRSEADTATKPDGFGPEWPASEVRQGLSYRKRMRHVKYTDRRVTALVCPASCRGKMTGMDSRAVAWRSKLR
jgi:hypothetical protein